MIIGKCISLKLSFTPGPCPEDCACNGDRFQIQKAVFMSGTWLLHSSPAMLGTANNIVMLQEKINIIQKTRKEMSTAYAIINLYCEPLSEQLIFFRYF